MAAKPQVPLSATEHHVPCGSRLHPLGLLHLPQDDQSGVPHLAPDLARSHDPLSLDTPEPLPTRISPRPAG